MGNGMSGFDLQAMMDVAKKGLLLFTDLVREGVEAVRRLMADQRFKTLMVNAMTLLLREIDDAKPAEASNEKRMGVVRKEMRVRLRARRSAVAHRRRERRHGRGAMWAATVLLDEETAAEVADFLRDDIETRLEEGLQVSRWIGVQFLWNTVGPMTIQRLTGRVAMKVRGL
jgi:hypothetical protein